MKLYRVWIGLALLMLTTGCYTFRDDVDEFMFTTRNKLYAEQAWQASKSMYSDVECRSHFADGFCAGYRNVAAGGNGCVPKLPPRKYWKVGYQSPAGRQKALAWFNGYSHGAVAAEQDGVAGWSRITVAPNTCPSCVAAPGGELPSPEPGPPMLPSEALPPLGSDTEAAPVGEASDTVREVPPLAVESDATGASAPH
jgi:hypothetical protein